MSSTAPPCDAARPDGVGVMVLRVWRETYEASSLRVRLLCVTDVDRPVRETAAAASVEETLDLVRAWLERFPPPAPDEPSLVEPPARR